MTAHFVTAHVVGMGVRKHDYVSRGEMNIRVIGAPEPALALYEDVKERHAFCGGENHECKLFALGRRNPPWRRKLCVEEDGSREADNAEHIGKDIHRAFMQQPGAMVKNSGVLSMVMGKRFS